MNCTERFYRINPLIADRGVMGVRDLQRELEISPATLRRDLAFMRARLNAPIVFDRETGGYRFDGAGVGPRFQLPGLWFSADEILAPLSMHQMLDSLEHAALTDAKAKDVALEKVDEETAGGYGIYRGNALHWGTLVFSQEAARWVRFEVWHEKQRCRDLPDGRFELAVPYSQSTEIEMDILRHGEHVEVVEPAELKNRIAKRLQAARRQYDA